MLIDYVVAAGDSKRGTQQTGGKRPDRPEDLKKDLEADENNRLSKKPRGDPAGDVAVHMDTGDDDSSSGSEGASLCAGFVHSLDCLRLSRRGWRRQRRANYHRCDSRCRRNSWCERWSAILAQVGCRVSLRLGRRLVGVAARWWRRDQSASNRFGCHS